jgi:AraC-like DNA-binding protein
LLGPDLPHCWKTADAPLTSSESVVIHFRHEFMGEDFLAKPELKRIASMLHQSQAGLHYPADLKKHRHLFMGILQEDDHFSKWMLLMQLLHLLSLTRRIQAIDKQFAKASLSGTDLERINTITAHIVANFQQKISLDKAAATVNMTPTALCRYFKKITRKTFIEAVNDYRIDYAINKLTQSEQSVAGIAYESGFNDLSNFNKMFRQRSSLSPLQYRKKFRRET